jgi:CBS domain containing-hemolysin-like protein
MTAKLLTCLILSGCLTLSFLLSGMEAGVFALSRLRIRQQMRAGKPSARVLYGLLENPETFLWTIVVGNTVVNFAVLGWAFAKLHPLTSLGRAWFAVIYVLVVLIFYMFFDLLPKMVFRLYPNRLCLALARPFQWVHLGLRPLVRIVEWCSQQLLKQTGGKAFTGHLFGNREELRLMMRESANVISSAEQAMVERVLDLQNITVRQITRPLPDVVSVTAETPVMELLRLCREKQITRLPVWQERDGQRRIAGIINVDDVLFSTKATETAKAAEFVKPALFLAEDVRLEVALQRMQRAGLRLAVVLGRNGREAGVVSLEDILKTVFGEVRL